MMAHRDRRGGSLILDVRLAGVGRIKRASGTDSPAVLRRMVRDLHDLAADGRLDVLRAVRDGTLRPLVLRDAVRRRQVDRLVVGLGAGPLAETWRAWAEAKDCSPAHRRSLLQSLRHLQARPDATVGDLPALVLAARERLAAHPQSFRLLRAAAQAYVKHALGRRHAVYGDVGAVELLRVRPVRAKHPATVAELSALLESLPTWARDVAFVMSRTGMRANELWGRWTVDRSRVVIHGTKTGAAERAVPNVLGGRFQGVPAHQYAAFRRALGKASDGQMRPYDLRRTYATWLEAAGVPRTRRRLYLGHGAGDVTDLYEWHEVERFLEEDAARLRALLGDGAPAKLEVVK